MPDGWRQADKPEALPGATETRVSAPGKKADPRGKPEGISSDVMRRKEGWDGDSGCRPVATGSPETALAPAGLPALSPMADACSVAVSGASRKEEEEVRSTEDRAGG